MRNVLQHLVQIAPRARSALALSLACLLASCLAWPAAAQETDPEKVLAGKSLPLRTALHHDPSLKAPLDRLLALYQEAGKADELVKLYEMHVQQYPQDQNALTVLVRLKMATVSPEALRTAQNAVARFADNALLHYSLYEILQRRHDSKALEHLEKAVSLQTNPSRKAIWVDQLLSVATRADRRDLAEKHLQSLAATANAADARLQLARRMNRYEFHQLALKLLEKAKENEAAPSPETMVAIQLEAAASQVGLGQNREASQRLDALLQKLTADYWQRGEIIRRRLSLIGSQEQRDKIIAAARKEVEQNPRDEAAALDLAQILAALQFRRQALEVLLAAGDRLQKSEAIEMRILEVFDRLRDGHGRAEYLQKRIKLQPMRNDLALHYVKTRFQLGHREQAREALAPLLESLDESQRIKTALEIARFLRRNAMVADAAEMMQQLVDDSPQRLDLRRELAEIFLVLGQRSRVKPLFMEEFPEDASLENIMDVVQFMMQQELLVEAQSAVERRLKKDKDHLELILLLVDLQRRLGNAGGGERIEQCRELADTAARYRLWLEAAVAFHDTFETAQQFLDQEAARLDAEGADWNARRLQRRLTFADVAAQNERIDAAVAMLQNDLAEEPPREIRVSIRQKIIELIEKDAARLADVQQQLRLLAEDDTRLVDETRARLALLHVRAQRHDLAQPLLNQIDLSRIQNPLLLSSLEPLYRNAGRQKDIVFILGRLTELNPTDRSNWQRWLTVLAGNGDESRLRGAVRRLLSGVQKMPLSETTRALLEKHLADSYWRSIARYMAKENDASLAEALVLLDTVERMAQDDQQWLWVAWIRAFALNRLGRTDARDEAIGELEQMVKRVYDPKELVKPEDRRIVLPDGLSIDVAHARRLLTDKPDARVRSLPQFTDGPLPDYQLRWAFQHSAGIQSLLPLKDDRLLIVDSSGGLQCVHAGSGKLLWSRSGVVTLASAQERQILQTFGLPASAGPLTDHEGRIFIASAGEVACRAGEDGRLLWKALVGDAAGSPAAAVSMFLYNNVLLTYEPRSGTITKVDKATGKVVWDMMLAAKQPVAIGRHNSGASLSGDRLLVYGSRSAVVNVQTGHVLWSFEPWRVRNFPVELKDPVEEKDMAGASSVAAAPPPPPHGVVRYPVSRASNFAFSRSGHSPFSHIHTHPPVAAWSSFSRPTPQQQPIQRIDYLAATGLAGAQVAVQSAQPQFRMSLTTPAVLWASQVNTGSPRRAYLTERTVVLMDYNGTLVIRTDLPLAGKRIAVTGAYLGSVGNTACFLQSQNLHMVNLRTAESRGYNVTQAASGPDKIAGAPVQVAMDGTLAYYSCPWGIHGVNVLTGQRVFRAAWPDQLVDRPEDDAKPPAAAVPIPPSAANAYQWRQLAAHQQYPPAHAAMVGPPANVMLAHDGVLYTLVSPTRLVALQGNRPDGG